MFYKIDYYRVICVETFGPGIENLAVIGVTFSQPANAVIAFDN